MTSHFNLRAQSWGMKPKKVDPQLRRTSMILDKMRWSLEGAAACDVDLLWWDVSVGEACVLAGVTRHHSPASIMSSPVPADKLLPTPGHKLQLALICAVLIYMAHTENTHTLFIYREILIAGNIWAILTRSQAKSYCYVLQLRIGCN